MVYANNWFLRRLYVITVGIICLFEGMTMILTVGIYQPNWKVSFGLFMLLREAKRMEVSEIETEAELDDALTAKLPPQWNCGFCGYGEYILADKARASFRRNEHEFLCNLNPNKEHNWSHSHEFYDYCQIPPPGWACTREPQHPGPCAAYSIG